MGLRWKLGAFAAVLVLGAGAMWATSGEPQPPKLGKPGRQVTVVRGAQVYPLTAEVVSWEVKRHPQVPHWGTAVHLTTRFTGHSPELTVELLVCAVDRARIVLGCAGLHRGSPEDLWIGPSETSDFTPTAEVVVFPDQMFAGHSAGDWKDHDGYRPPRGLLPGDRLE